MKTVITRGKNRSPRYVNSKGLYSACEIRSVMNNTYYVTSGYIANLLLYEKKKKRANLFKRFEVVLLFDVSARTVCRRTHVVVCTRILMTGHSITSHARKIGPCYYGYTD